MGLVDAEAADALALALSLSLDALALAEVTRDGPDPLDGLAMGEAAVEGW